MNFVKQVNRFRIRDFETACRHFHLCYPPGTFMLYQGHSQKLLVVGIFLLLLLSPAIFSFKDSVLPGRDDSPLENRVDSENNTDKNILILKKQTLPGIDNFLKISKLLYSGGTPQNKEAFKILSRLGIKTIISVDGNRPQVELARKQGLKYIHIPIGYDGIQKNESSAIVRVVKEYPQPFYFHCHHGKHRGPSAAAIACIASNQVTNRNAINILVQAGTSQEYPGLWNDVKNFHLPDTDQVLPELREVSKVDSLTTVMVKMDERFNGIQQWLKKKKLADIHLKTESAEEFQSVAELSILLAEDLRESGRNLVSGHETGFRQMLAQSEKMARKLNQSLKLGHLNPSREIALSLKKSCNRCHQSYRN